MLYTFTKEDGRNIGIDLAKIVDVDDCGLYRTIGTTEDEYTVVDSYEEIVNAVNQYKTMHLLRFYN